MTSVSPCLVPLRAPVARELESRRLDISAIDPREARAAVLNTAVDVHAPGGARAAEAGGARPTRRGLHSSTFQLNVSTFCGIKVAFGGCSGGVRVVLGGNRGWPGSVFVSEAAQVKLKSGRV
jgi:hypothetical protein